MDDSGVDALAVNNPLMRLWKDRAFGDRNCAWLVVSRGHSATLAPFANTWRLKRPIIPQLLVPERLRNVDNKHSCFTLKIVAPSPIARVQFALFRVLLIKPPHNIRQILQRSNECTQARRQGVGASGAYAPPPK